MKSKTSHLLIIIILLSLASACAAPKQSPTSSVITPVPPYPAPVTEVPVFNKNAKPFELIKPILEGATEVSGTGLPGVPINILDVTFMGEYLGSGTINPDGSFIIQVKPLEKDHQIGIALGDLDGTQWKPEDFQSPAYHGDEALSVPMVGFFFDTAMVGY